MSSSPPDRDPDVVAVTEAALHQEKVTYTRRTQVAMAIEGTLALLLGAVGVALVLASTAPTATVIVFRLGVLQFALIAAVGLAGLVALRFPPALRRVALVKAVVMAALFVAGAAYSYYDPAGMWDVNAAGALVPAALALAGFAEFIFLGSERFVSTPSEPAYPDRDRGGRWPDDGTQAPDQR